MKSRRPWALAATIGGAVAAALFLFPDAAFAWGPATHLELSSRILENLQLLPAGLADILRAHPLDFFYGSIAADIVVAKRFSHYLHHCHRWTTGLEVLESAEKPSQKAFALGYLTHLAEDVVAHNYYVPYKVILSFNSRGQNHAFWEIRFDTTVPAHVWEVPPQISRDMHLDNDELLKKILAKQLFSFQTNKVFFNNVLLLGRFKKWQTITHKALRQSKPELDAKRVDRYKQLSLDAAVAFLSDREDAWCFRADPTGHQSLKAAASIVRHLRKARNKGELSRDLFVGVLERYRPHLEASIYAKPNADELVHAAVAMIEAEAAA